MGKIADVDTPASVITLSDFSMIDKNEAAVDPKPLNTNLFKGADLTDANDWEIWIDPKTVTGTSEIKEGKATFVLSKIGTEDYQPQFKQSGIQLEKGCKYQLTMDVNSTIDRNIIFKFQQDGGTWAVYKQEEKQLTSGDNSIFVEFVMENDTDAQALFCAAMGAQEISDEHTIIFSNVKLVKVAEAAN